MEYVRKPCLYMGGVEYVRLAQYMAEVVTIVTHSQIIVMLQHRKNLVFGITFIQKQNIVL